MQTRPVRFMRCRTGTAKTGLRRDQDELGELVRDLRHRLFCSIQATAGRKQRAHIAESDIRCLVYDRNQPVTGEERRKFFIGDALCWETTQKRWGDQHDPYPRVRQALVDSAEQRNAKADVLLAEPDFDAARLKRVVQLFGDALPVVPSMTEECVPKVGQ